MFKKYKEDTRIILPGETLPETVSTEVRIDPLTGRTARITAPRTDDPPIDFADPPYRAHVRESAGNLSLLPRSHPRGNPPVRRRRSRRRGGSASANRSSSPTAPPTGPTARYRPFLPIISSRSAHLPNATIGITSSTPGTISPGFVPLTPPSGTPPSPRTTSPPPGARSSTRTCRSTSLRLRPTTSACWKSAPRPT